MYIHTYEQTCRTGDLSIIFHLNPKFRTSLLAPSNDPSAAGSHPTFSVRSTVRRPPKRIRCLRRMPHPYLVAVPLKFLNCFLNLRMP